MWTLANLGFTTFAVSIMRRIPCTERGQSHDEIQAEKEPKSWSSIQRFKQNHDLLNIFEGGYEARPIQLSDTQIKASRRHRSAPNRNSAQNLPPQAAYTVRQPKRHRSDMSPYTGRSVS